MLAPKTRPIRLATIAFAAVARFLFDRRSARNSEDTQLAAAATYGTRTSEKPREIDAIEAAHLREEIGAPDQVLGRRHAEKRCDPRELVAEGPEEAHHIRDRSLELLRLESLQAFLDRFGGRWDLRRDADMAGVGLGAAADRAPRSDHPHRPATA